MKRKIGILLVIVGIALFGGANYIMNQVAAGKIKIEEGEQSVGRANTLFSLSPTLKQFGQGSVDKGEAQIAQGKKDLAYYTRLAGQMQVGGIICFAVGVVLIVMTRKKRR